jgi:hypothetical protein
VSSRQIFSSGHHLAFPYRHILNGWKITAAIEKCCAFD